jgi:hypothetical protein
MTSNYPGLPADGKRPALRQQERAHVLRAFPREVPHGVEFFVRLRISVFRIEG